MFNAVDSIRTYTFQEQTYLKYVAIKTALRNLILNSIDDKYVNELQDENTVYTLVTPLEFKTYIWTNYASIDDADHARNEENMKRQ